jgi:predicted transcriptional regulator
MDKQSIKLLEEIKKLIVLQLINQGVQSKDVAATLNVDPAVISRMVPRKKNSLYSVND